jgi:dienelactone hydrolase
MVNPEIEESQVHFSAAGTRYMGMLFEGGDAAHVIVLPDWRGRTAPFARERGEELARRLRARVLVTDCYGVDYTPKDYQDDAERWIRAALSDPVGLRPKLAGFARAATQAMHAPGNLVVVVGYCLGGALAFEVGRAETGVAAVVCIHGIPSSNAPIAQLASSTCFLAIHGGSDRIIEPSQLEPFRREMTDANVDWRTLLIGHARHGFTDEGARFDGAYQRYDHRAHRRATQAIASLIEELKHE